MAARPKLSPDQWRNVRDTWESSPKKGFPWLIEALNLPVSAEAIRQRAKAEGWKKNSEKPSLENEKPSLESKKTKLASHEKNNASKRTLKAVKTAKKPVEKSLVVLDGGGGGKTNKGGRPTKYREEYAEQARKLCLLGYTDKELAEFFGVVESTINEWKLDHMEFSESLKSGKAIADADIAASLYEKAKGYSHPDVHISNFGGQITVTEITKHYPPDTAAAFIWLKNRQSKRWRDKVDVGGNLKLDKTTLEEIKATFMERMRKARERQEKLTIERGLLIEHEKQD